MASTLEAMVSPNNVYYCLLLFAKTKRYCAKGIGAYPFQRLEAVNVAKAQHRKSLAKALGSMDSSGLQGL